MSWQEKWNRVAAIWIVVVIIEAILVIAVLVSGISIRRELSSSMTPTITRGDLVVFAKTPVKDIQKGAVIAFADPLDHQITVMHQVVRVAHLSDGRIDLITQGRANPSVDPWILQYQGDMSLPQAVVVMPIALAVAIVLTPIAFGIILGVLGVVEGNRQRYRERERCMDVAG